MSANPVTYAERELGVHDVWERHNTAIEKLTEAQRDLVAAERRLRFLKERATDREYEIITECDAFLGEMAVSARNAAIKRMTHDDTAMRNIRSDIEDAEGLKADASVSVRTCEMDLRGISARMEELAGLLRFYAAAKEQA